jgi:hypothetical protein
MRATPDSAVAPTLGGLGRLNCQWHMRSRVVIVVDGVMSIQGDGSADHKAKDHSRALSPQRISCNCVVGFLKLR